MTRIHPAVKVRWFCRICDAESKGMRVLKHHPQRGAHEPRPQEMPQKCHQPAEPFLQLQPEGRGLPWLQSALAHWCRLPPAALLLPPPPPLRLRLPMRLYRAQVLLVDKANRVTNASELCALAAELAVLFQSTSRPQSERTGSNEAEAEKRPRAMQQVLEGPSPYCEISQEAIFMHFQAVYGDPSLENVEPFEWPLAGTQSLCQHSHYQEQTMPQHLDEIYT
ncbi:hypothetical protein ACLKA7_011400 [Drosophila subpalustris]